MLLLADIANYLFPAGMALLVVVLLRMTLRKRRKQAKRKPAVLVLHPNERALAAPTLAPLHGREVELHEALREIRADVATRIGLLMQHTLSARAEADRLKAAVRHARELGLAPTGDTLEALQAGLEAAGGENGAELLDAALARLGTALVPTISPRDRDAIYRLAAEGHSASSIARQLGLPQGDVELLLQLGPTLLVPQEP